MRGLRKLLSSLLVALGLTVMHSAASALLPEHIDQLDAYLQSSESRHADIVPGTEKHIVWFGGERLRRPVALVYLHGYSASRQETAPLPERLAAVLGANLFETRLRGHGRGSEAMLDGSVEAWQQDVTEAMNIAAMLGERIVVLSVSTGSTLAAWWEIAEMNPVAAAQVMISPNFSPRNHRVFLLDWPVLGPLLLDYLVPAYYEWTPNSAAQARYWTWRYPTRSMIEMVRLVKVVAGLDKSRARSPTLMLYSPADQVIDVDEIRTAFGDWGSVDKSLQAVDGAGGESSHVIAGDISSPQSTDQVLQLIEHFLADRVGLALVDRRSVAGS